MGDGNPQMSQQIMLAVGAHGLTVTVPAGVQVLPVGQSVEAGEALDAEKQQRLVRDALDKPGAGPPLSELARGHRRAAILVGDLSLPAPYDIALPPVIAQLLEAEIRPSRICILACPGTSGPILGSAAIRRYGEEIAGQYELRAWQSADPQQDQPDPFYAAADLRVALLPPLPWSAPGIPKSDFAVGLALGRKLRMDIVSANAPPAPEAEFAELETSVVVVTELSPNPQTELDSTSNTDMAETASQQPQTTTTILDVSVDSNVFLLSGGGADWETTLEEALLSLHLLACAPVPDGRRVKGSAVLAFAAEGGLGSARFTLDLWSLLKQAEEVLAAGGALTVPVQALGAFDPAATLARTLSVFEQLILLSPGLARHEEGTELVERLAELPAASRKVRLCTGEEELWALLARAHGGSYRLAIEPLGWRGAAQG